MKRKPEPKRPVFPAVLYAKVDGEHLDSFDVNENPAMLVDDWDRPVQVATYRLVEVRTGEAVVHFSKEENPDPPDDHGAVIRKNL